MHHKWTLLTPSFTHMTVGQIACVIAHQAAWLLATIIGGVSAAAAMVVEELQEG